MASIKPLGNRLLVKPKKANVSIGGILLPESAQQKPKEGTVIAVGPGESLDHGERRPLALKVGDEVLFTAYSGHEVAQNGQDYLILSENDVLGVLTPQS